MFQKKQAMAVEVRFNSVEVELARRWAHNEVPMFVGRPVEVLRKVVKAWWQIYHEAAAAASGQNRTIWNRNNAYPAEALDTPSLINALSEIRKKINLKDIGQYRPIHQAEYSAIGLLDMIIAHYINLNNQTPS
ncbi:hypothetical protein [Spirosoma aerophilum]